MKINPVPDLATTLEARLNISGPRLDLFFSIPTPEEMLLPLRQNLSLYHCDFGVPFNPQNSAPFDIQGAGYLLAVNQTPWQVLNKN
jgi:hypothetical protein